MNKKKYTTSEDPEAFVGPQTILKQRLHDMGLQPLEVVLTDNRKAMIRATKAQGVYHLRVHQMFVQAPDAIIAALARFVRFRDADASQVLRVFVDDHIDQLRYSSDFQPREPRVHSLTKIFAHANDLYFEGKLQLNVRYRAVKNGRVSRESIRFGTYIRSSKTIEIDPRLDHESVPEWFIEFVIYHEMLHHVLGVQRNADRRVIHGPAFRLREKMHAAHTRAIAWKKANLERVIDLPIVN